MLDPIMGTFIGFGGRTLPVADSPTRIFPFIGLVVVDACTGHFFFGF